jgi:hypothetical protein
MFVTMKIEYGALDLWAVIAGNVEGNIHSIRNQSATSYGTEGSSDDCNVSLSLMFELSDGLNRASGGVFVKVAQ